MVLEPPPSALLGISPPRGEIDPRRPLVLTSMSRMWQGEFSQPISPLEGEMPGRAEGGSHIKGAKENRKHIPWH